MTDALFATLTEAVRHWGKNEPVMAALAKDNPPAELPIEVPQDPFEFLVQSITHQQVSLAAGRTIFGRVKEALEDVRPEAALAAGEDRLRACGLSRMKCAYVSDLASRIVDGELELAAVASMDDQAATKVLTQVKGIGTWSAKMFLMFHLQRPDVVCPEDLGLRMAVSRFYEVPEDAAAKELVRLSALWSPYNTLAARVLWHARRTNELAGAS